MSQLLEGAVTQTEIQTVVFKGSEAAGKAVEELLECTAAGEAHLAFVRQEGAGWQVRGVVIDRPAAPVVQAVPDGGEVA